MNLGVNITGTKHLKSSLWMLGLLLVFITTSCGTVFTGPNETRDDSFVVGESPRVVVIGDNGRIIVNPGLDGAVRVQAILRKPNDLEYKAFQEGNTIRIDAKEQGLGIFNFGGIPGADIEYFAPPCLLSV